VSVVLISVELLRQRSRPYLFSNSVAPHIGAATLKALELIESSPRCAPRCRTTQRTSALA
jgi:glycine C-acetyltransferase